MSDKTSSSSQDTCISAETTVNGCLKEKRREVKDRSPLYYVLPTFGILSTQRNQFHCHTYTFQPSASLPTLHFHQLIHKHSQNMIWGSFSSALSLIAPINGFKLPLWYEQTYTVIYFFYQHCTKHQNMYFRKPIGSSLPSSVLCVWQENIIDESSYNENLVLN